MVSIIVPIYNSEEYLEECLDNLLCQTCGDIEIVLVDDGSQDYSPEICDKYAQKESRIKVIHKQNAGVSAARNTGIDSARGEYIMFCDSDDVVHPHWVEYHLRAINENPDSFVISNITKFSGDVPNIMPLDYITENCSFYEIFKKCLSGFPFNKIYSHKIIKDNHLRFDESVPLAEDVIFNAHYYRHCSDGCVYLNMPLYYYRDNLGSALHRYKKDALLYHTKAFYERALAIEPEFIQVYCDEWLNGSMNVLDNIFDERNTSMSYFHKLRYNQEVVSSEAFHFAVTNCTNRVLHSALLYMLRWRCYYFYWVIQRMITLCSRNRR